MTLANGSGPVAGGTVTTVQAALDKLSPVTDVNTTQNSSAHSISASGTVKIAASLLTAAQARMDADWSSYLAGAQIGTRVYLEVLSRIVGDAIAADPASNFTGQALGGADPDGNVTLAATEVPVPSAALSTLLTFVTT